MSQSKDACESQRSRDTGISSAEGGDGGGAGDADVVRGDRSRTDAGGSSGCHINLSREVERDGIQLNSVL